MAILQEDEFERSKKILFLQNDSEDFGVDSQSLSSKETQSEDETANKGTSGSSSLLDRISKDPTLSFSYLWRDKSITDIHTWRNISRRVAANRNNYDVNYPRTRDSKEQSHHH
jgi:hypothetical protein